MVGYSIVCRMKAQPLSLLWLHPLKPHPYNLLGKIVEHYEAELAKSQTLCDELKRRSEETGEEKIKVWARFSRTLRMSKSFFKMIEFCFSKKVFVDVHEKSKLGCRAAGLIDRIAGGLH